LEEMVDGIRTLAAIFYALGWIVLCVAGLLGAGLLLSAIARGGGVGGFFEPLTSVATLCAASLSPFFCWAVLEMLLEIHAKQESILSATFRAIDTVGVSAFGPPAREVVPSSTLPALPRTIG
jgi:hypothetical protein